MNELQSKQAPVTGDGSESVDAPPAEERRLDRFVALRHVLVFQLKLAADALRDFVLSPLSLAAFALDALRQPPESKSYYLRLMRLGRRSDRMINLFGAQRSDSRFSIDRAVDDLEGFVRRAARETRSGEKCPNSSRDSSAQRTDR